MPKKLKVTREVSVEELETRYRAAVDPVERSRLQMVWLVARGVATAEVASVTGYCTRSVRDTLHRFNAEGFDGMRDRRHDAPGHAPLLDPTAEEELRNELLGEPEDGGLWSGLKVTRWIERRIGRPISPDAGLRWLHRLGFRLRTPRPSHAKANKEDQTEGVQGELRAADRGDRAGPPLRSRLGVDDGRASHRPQADPS